MRSRRVISSTQLSSFVRSNKPQRTPRALMPPLFSTLFFHLPLLLSIVKRLTLRPELSPALSQPSVITSKPEKTIRRTILKRLLTINLKMINLRMTNLRMIRRTILNTPSLKIQHLIIKTQIVIKPATIASV